MSAPLSLYNEHPPFVFVRFPPALRKALDGLFYSPPGEQELLVLGVLSQDMRVLHLNSALLGSGDTKMPSQCNGEVRTQSSGTFGLEIIRRVFDEGTYGSRTATHALLFARSPRTVTFNLPLKYLKHNLMEAPSRPQSILAKKPPSRTAALDNDNVFFKYFDHGARGRSQQFGDVALHTIRNRLFLMLERKGSDGVNLKEAIMETGASPHIVRKVLDQIARPFGVAGRTIWILQNQYTSL